MNWYFADCSGGHTSEDVLFESDEEAIKFFKECYGSELEAVSKLNREFNIASEIYTAEGNKQ